jgi:hypothetical protein
MNIINTTPAANPAESTAVRPRKRLRAAIDHRTRMGRRARELVRLYRDRMGDTADELTVSAAIVAAAEMQSLAEDLRRRALRGEPIPPDDVVRTQRTADLMVRRLVDRPQPQPDPDHALAEYLRGAS